MNIVVIPDTTGYAPADEKYHAIDDETFDPDAPRQIIGYGRTPALAIADFYAALRESQEP